VIVEFVGGAHDGLVMDVQDDRNEILMSSRVPQAPEFDISAAAKLEPVPYVVHRYSRKGDKMICVGSYMR
jgi:hypothetical protein